MSVIEIFFHVFIIFSYVVFILICIGFLFFVLEKIYRGIVNDSQTKNSAWQNISIVDKRKEDDLLESMGIIRPKTSEYIIINGDGRHTEHNFQSCPKNIIREYILPTFEDIDGWIGHYYTYEECECGAIKRNDTVALI